MQGGNDIFTAAVSGGLIGDISELNGAINGHNTIQAVTSGINIIDGANSLMDAYKQW
jgi:hypothetical protein